MKQKIAVIGSGISGLTCCHYLDQKFDVDLYEANDYLGGHTHTHSIWEGEKELFIDTGFIVFNQKTYPNFIKMLKRLEAPYQKSDMSFSVKCQKTGLEYNGSNLNKLFSQRLNLFKPKFYKFLFAIMDFNKKAKNFVEQQNSEITFKQFIEREKIDVTVVEYYLRPMVCAVWSADASKVDDFPALFLMRFWYHHGFLEVNDRPQWFVVKGGSKKYVEKIVEKFSGEIFLSRPVRKIERNEDHVVLHFPDGQRKNYDKVIVATHSDQALALLDQPLGQEKSLLESIPYQKNSVLLHTDTSVLPKKKRAWASWNYELVEQKDLALVHYNMNILQSLNAKKVYCVSLNCDDSIESSKVIKELTYHHPIYTAESIKQQEEYSMFMGAKNTFFCGAYMKSGFHEDGVVSALRVCKYLGASA